MTHAATISLGQATSALLFLPQCNSNVPTSNCSIPGIKHLSPGAVPDFFSSFSFQCEIHPGKTPWTRSPSKGHGGNGRGYGKGMDVGSQNTEKLNTAFLWCAGSAFPNEASACFSEALGAHLSHNFIQLVTCDLKISSDIKVRAINHHS